MDPTAPKPETNSFPDHDPVPHPVPSTPNPVGTEPFVEQFPAPSEPSVTEPVGPVIANPPTDTPPNPEPPAPKAKKSIFPVLMLLIILVGVAAAGVFFWPQIKDRLLTQSSPSPTPDLSVSSPSPVAMVGSDALAYLKNSDVYLGEEKLSTSSAVFKYAHPSNLDYIVYIEGTKIEVPSGQPYIEPNKVKVVNTASKETTTIFELTPTSPFGNNPDYKIMIRDIGISSAGETIAITTSDSIYFYSLATKQLEKVYENKLSSVTAGSVWGLHNPLFSPDDKKIILTLGHYEGSSQGLFNIETKALTELPYEAYISGEKVVGWTGNSEMLVITYTDQTAENVETVFSKVPVDTLAKSEIAKLPYGWIDVKVAGNTAYLLGTSSTLAGKGPNDVDLYNRFQHIIKVNLQSGQYTESYKLTTEDAEVQETEVKSFSGAKLAPSGEELYVNMSVWRQPPAASQTDIYSLNLSNNSFTKVKEQALVY